MISNEYRFFFNIEDYHKRINHIRMKALGFILKACLDFDFSYGNVGAYIIDIIILFKELT
jgi:hypothetical protein